uniref:Uncharacterized protein n=1 Tax=Timema monikensis TaxID=170555 RepID=A0A7R9HTY6_9NEOP|nr:unnamed protein product [Timema monikensis]
MSNVGAAGKASQSVVIVSANIQFINHQDWPSPIILNRQVGRASYDVPTRRSPLCPVQLTRNGPASIGHD